MLLWGKSEGQPFLQNSLSTWGSYETDLITQNLLANTIHLQQQRQIIYSPA